MKSPTANAGGVVVLAVLACVWIATVAAGSAAVLVYQNTPGATGEPSERWPDSAPVAREANRPTLLMFAHPRCPCTRASVEELARLTARRPGRFATRVIFLKPSRFADGWERSDLWRSAAAIPGVRVLADTDGRIAGSFGAATSGQVLLYDVDGRLRFQGGITASRGHAGDNAGRSILMTLVDGDSVERRKTPVFGCPLADSENCDGESCPRQHEPRS